jgi:hypothetical protein
MLRVPTKEIIMELPITLEQANYLNVVARTARLYRVTNERMQRDLADNMSRIQHGQIPMTVRHQDAADIMVSAGQLDAMCSTAYSVFPGPATKDHSDLVNGYLKAAMTLDTHDYIMMKH